MGLAIMVVCVAAILITLISGGGFHVNWGRPVLT